jgi:dephospho-CoA kinase
MLKVALTGNVASGKTTVAEIWSAEGVPVIRADDLAREVVAPGTDGLDRVVEAFGREILLEDGSLDRAKLRDRVFRQEAERLRLEGILHPLIGALRTEWVGQQEESGVPLVVAEIPLLFEAGLEGDYDSIVLVVAPFSQQLLRLERGRGLDETEATRIAAAQIPSDEKVPRADFVIDNSGTLEDLKIRSLALLDLLRARARKGQEA